MFLQFENLSVNAVALVTAMSPSTMFVLFFAVVLLVWIFAVIRKTVGMSALSSLCWFSFSISLYIVGDVTNGITLGFSILGGLLGIIMVLLSIFQAFEMLKEAATEKQRQYQEEIM